MNKDWLYFDDLNVTLIEEPVRFTSNLINSHPYILVYIKSENKMSTSNSLESFYSNNQSINEDINLDDGISFLNILYYF